MPIANTCSIGYPHDGRADNAAYRHDRRADKRRYRHDRRADSLSQECYGVEEKLILNSDWLKYEVALKNESKTGQFGLVSSFLLVNSSSTRRTT